MSGVDPASLVREEAPAPVVVAPKWLLLMAMIRMDNGSYVVFDPSYGVRYTGANDQQILKAIDDGQNGKPGALDFYGYPRLMPGEKPAVLLRANPVNKLDIKHEAKTY
jgi:hypothetical protein